MSVSTNKWLKFFTEAGLPSGVATNYAIIFTNHRIQNNMLSDLTKEILYDMGIKTMGDVIAILRHAKSVDHNTTVGQLLGKPDRVGDAVNPSSAGLRPTLTANSQTGRPLAHRFNAISAPDSTQKPSSTSNVISLKRSAQTSALITSTNPKIRRVVVSDDNDLNDEDMDDFDLNNGSQNHSNHSSLQESLRTSNKNSSVFSRLGNEKNLDKNASIFGRLGNTSGIDSNQLHRRVTISGNSINTTLNNKNIIKLNKNDMKSNFRSNSLVNTRSAKFSPKIAISAPNSSGMRSTQRETVNVRERIGINTNSIKTSNRLVVNRSLPSNRLNASSSVAQAKRIAMRRAAESKPKTISLRKNIFDRLGPISL